MNEEGLWQLFFLTGLPEVWLALHAAQEEGWIAQQQPAMTAFAPQKTGKTEI